MNELMKVAVDLLWVRPKQVGGIESYIRNLLDGFYEINEEFELWLLVSKDNANTFAKYTANKNFQLHICDVFSQSVKKRIIWQNLYLGKTIKKLGLTVCFEPYYCKPFLGTQGISFITTIHDLQALHYPEYFSKGKVLWMKFSWWNTIKTSRIIVAISSFVCDDIRKNYKISPEKIIVLYNPITVNVKEVMELSYIEKRYNIKNNNFFFTVSSLLPHKNLGILLEIMKKIIEEKLELPKKLIVSGVGGKSKTELENKIKAYGLENVVQLTPYMDDAERNALYKYSMAFLFPSIFEGFGMPPIEAMIFGTPVITTRLTSLEEVTQGRATYVDNPLDVENWIKQIQDCASVDIDFSVYDKKKIAKAYLAEFKKLFDKQR